MTAKANESTTSTSLHVASCNIFEILSKIEFGDKVEKKGNVQYLSWAHAWTLLKNNFPNAQRKIYEQEHSGLNYFTDGKTAYVKVGITIHGLEHIDYLPVMDFRNNSIPIEKITSMDINKAIQRSTTKAIAMHGLGLQLWTGEDIPTNVPETTPKNEPAPESELAELTEKSEDWSKVTNYVSDNYKMGIDKIGKQLNRRYKMSATIKKKIASIIEARLSLDEANGEETN
jgi:hypothetical protein